MRWFWPALLLAGCGGQPAIPPGKIVSNNPCVDAILAEIAAPGQVGAVSAWSHHADSGSASLDWARALPAIGASAEEIIAARPRLALIGSFGNAAPLVTAGIRHAAFGVPISVEESRRQIGDIASAIGRVEAGARLTEKIDLALRPEPSRQAKDVPAAIIWLSGGFVPGKGTLQDELLARAGYRNASAMYGLRQWEVLPLETLIRQPPDIIFTPLSERGDAGRALALRHRVLAQLRPAPRVIAFPDRLLNCGGPTIIEAMGVLKLAGDSARSDKGAL